ncbi:FHA domain-containing protein [Leptolyngbyaceae cyanobacterium JSC-12]|nr:FHA domain-containing protein [Leptolyngbyaceae cyanobacterium JSC-12]
MFDSNPLADLSSEYLNSAVGSSDLDQRLGLYRVFLKLYEHHRELLNEILDLENTENRHRVRGVWQYVQGGVQDGQAYLVTNLLKDKTQLLVQPQQAWVIGRDRQAGISVPDKRLSRRHALIQYVSNQGFYLIDLDSTNGTYLNGEAVRRPMLLKDGDRVRLGSLSFIFFACSNILTLDSVPADLLNRTDLTPTNPISASIPSSESSLEDEITSQAEVPDLDEPLVGSEKETSLFLKSPISQDHLETGTSELSKVQKDEILDRFLNR